MDRILDINLINLFKIKGCYSRPDFINVDLFQLEYEVCLSHYI
jgi:hypothetical protein